MGEEGAKMRKKKGSERTSAVVDISNAFAKRTSSITSPLRSFSQPSKPKRSLADQIDEIQLQHEQEDAASTGGAMI